MDAMEWGFGGKATGRQLVGSKAKCCMIGLDCERHDHNRRRVQRRRMGLRQAMERMERRVTAIRQATGKTCFYEQIVHIQSCTPHLDPTGSCPIAH
ncbi:hypothetical protein RUND412_006022 [Rhizina undulata]